MDYRIDNVTNLEHCKTELNGYYWDFPEVLFTWGQGLAHARLVKVQTPRCSVYLRTRVTQGTIASWQGEASPEAAQEVWQALSDGGIQTVKFQPLSVDMKSFLSNGYKGTVWFSRRSWRDMELSRNRRWQFTTSLKRYEFIPVGHSQQDLARALDIIVRWREIASKRQMLMGVGHYMACVRLHPQLSNSHLFFCRRKQTGELVGLVGGYIRDGYSVVVNVKHDFSDKFTIHALWGFWMDYVHSKGVLLNCNGSTSDSIKKRMRMEKRWFYKPPKLSLASVVPHIDILL